MVLNPQHPDQPERLQSGYSLVNRKATGQGSLSSWIALPDRPRPDAVPLVAIHGIRRGVRMQAAAFAARAAALGRPVIAPRFGLKRWPSYQRVVHRGRADLALLSLMEALRAEGIWTARHFDLFGYSGGAQFAHRFAMLHPHLVGRLALCSAGWWTFPDGAAFPYGLSAGGRRKDPWGPRIEAMLPRFLGLEILVAIGANDDVPDANTRSGPAIDAQQGPDRRTRSNRWVDAMHATAHALGIPPRLALAVLPNCGHSFRECIAQGQLSELVLPHGPEDHGFGSCPVRSDLRPTRLPSQT